jgi:hypothetical protein
LGNWSLDCDFLGNDLKAVQIKSEDCGSKVNGGETRNGRPGKLFSAIFAIFSAKNWRFS